MDSDEYWEPEYSDFEESLMSEIHHLRNEVIKFETECVHLYDENTRLHSKIKQLINGGSHETKMDK